MDLPEKILQRLSSSGDAVDSLSLASEWGLDHQKVVGAVKSLQCLDAVVRAEERSSTAWGLTAEGKEVADKGSHEFVAFCAVPAEGGIPQPELMKKVHKVGFSKAMSAGWIAIDKSSGKPMVVRKASGVEDKVKKDLALVRSGKAQEVGDKDKADYKKRKLLHEVQVKSYQLSKGEKFTTKIEKGETDLTAEMLSSGAWKTASFKDYNFDALGALPPAGHLHPLLKVRAEYRQIFLEMGFTEMPTNNFVESSFWNFDALFVPQKHPARDAQDTFFISDPAAAQSVPEDYKERVSKVHYEGGYGSQGYGVWSDEETRKNTLRTHTTAVSARMLHQLASQGEFKPQKYFSIDRVFRNETLDATHLAEFHQIEGVIADWDLSLGDLIGVLYEFFKKLGIEKLKFKPATNPYTEPSMEVFSYHEGLKKWVEIGNSGVFRPEMLLPMGLPEGVSVLGYGLSLERPTMIKYGIDNIRDLCGNKVNLKMVHENPICRLDKDTRNPRTSLLQVTERRWTAVEDKLKYLSSRINRINKLLGLKQGNSASQKTLDGAPVVIRADPSRPPYFLKVFLQEMAKRKTITASTHTHSSVRRLDQTLEDFLEINPDTPGWKAEQAFVLIWKQDERKSGGLPRMTVEGEVDIAGEVEIARYFARCSQGAVPYDSDLDPKKSALIDARLEEVASLEAEDDWERKLEEMMGRGKGGNSWLQKAELSLPSLLLWSWCKASRTNPRLPNLKKWLKEINNHPLVRAAA